MTISNLSNERGFAVVTAVVLMALMLSLGLVALSMTDTGSKGSREQRVRESALQLDEGVLYAQSLVLTTKWANARQPVSGGVHVGGRRQRQVPERRHPRRVGERELRERRPAQLVEVEDQGPRQRRGPERRLQPAAGEPRADDGGQGDLPRSVHLRLQRRQRGLGAGPVDGAGQAPQRRRPPPARGDPGEHPADRRHRRRDLRDQLRLPRRHSDHRRHRVDGARALSVHGHDDVRQRQGRSGRALRRSRRACRTS